MQVSLSIFLVSCGFAMKGGVATMIFWSLKKSWAHSFWILVHESAERSISYLLGHILHEIHRSSNNPEAFIPPATVVEISQGWPSPWSHNIHFLWKTSQKLMEWPCFTVTDCRKEGEAGFVNWNCIAGEKRSTSIIGLIEMKVNLSVTQWKMKPPPSIQHTVPLPDLRMSSSVPLHCFCFGIAHLTLAEFLPHLPRAHTLPEFDRHVTSNL